MTVDNTISLCQLCSDNILGFAQVLGSLATSGALIAMIINNRQQREQWLNDAFAKKEAEMWIDYREKFYTLTFENFIFFINCFVITSSYMINTNKKDFKKYFSELSEQFNDLRKLHRIYKPYFEKNITIQKPNKEKITYERIYSILDEIMHFYSELAEVIDFQPTTESINNIDYYIIRPNDLPELKEEFIWRGKSMYGEIPQNDKIQEYVRLFTEEINIINEALNEKVTAHLKK